MPPTAAFRLEGASTNVSGVGISGATLQLTLGCCLDADADPSLVYTPQAVDELEDPSGNDVAAFAHPHRQSHPPRTRARVGCGPGPRAGVSHSTLNLIRRRWSPADSFAVTADGSGVAIESVAVDGNDAVVTLSQWVAGHSAVTITYTPSSDGALRAAEGGYVRPIDERAVVE